MKRGRACFLGLAQYAGTPSQGKGLCSLVGEMFFQNRVPCPRRLWGWERPQNRQPRCRGGAVPVVPHAKGITVQRLRSVGVTFPFVCRRLRRTAGEGQSGGRSGMDMGTGQHASPAVGALQRRGRTRIAGIQPQRAGCAAGVRAVFAGAAGERALQARRERQPGHEREQDGLRTDPAAPQPFSGHDFRRQHEQDGQKGQSEKISSTPLHICWLISSRME